MKSSFVALVLLASVAAPAAAQVSVMSIPALPPGVTAPRPAAPVAPAAPSPSLPTVTTLPTGKAPLPGEYQVSIAGPGSVKAGEANTWDFNLSNTGKSNFHMEYGACDVRFEVLNAAGQVVRPDPKDALCTLQLVIFDAAPGETARVQKLRWEGKDGSGKPVPAGDYTIRAKMINAGRFTPAATFAVTVR